METLQHFLIFSIQFTFISGITVIAISFVNYVIPSQQFQGINDSDLVTIEESIKPNNIVDLPCARSEVIAQTIEIVNIDPVVENISQIDITNINLRTARKIAKTLGIK